MSHPLLYEINTRCWLRGLSQVAGKAVTLQSVPDSQFAQWKELGFTHIWLMGVWTAGPRARAKALNNPFLRREYAEALPDWRDQDVAASPYAISAYRVPTALGGDAGLEHFHHRLRQHGLKLLLDFVPNHFGLDHPWLSERPDLLVQSPQKVPGTFRQETPFGTRWLAHGKDPYMPSWTDTVQIDYRVPEARAEMLRLLQAVARRCDGVRCDMAMLVLNDVFAKTWEQFPPAEPLVPSRKPRNPHPPPGVLPQEEFWSGAIAAVKEANPDFLFLAEVYWGVEPRLQALGFDYTYDKVLYDRLVAREADTVRPHLLGLKPEVVAGGAHFLENHDERRVASLLSHAEHRAAALVILGLPGMRFLHEGQLSGARRKLPVQLARRALEPPEPEVEAFYRQILAALPASLVGQGTPELLPARPAWPDNLTAQDFVLVQWQSQAPEFDLVVVNLASHRSQCYAPLTISDLPDHAWSLRDRLGPEVYERDGEELREKGLYLDLPAHGAQLFHFRPVS